MLVVNPEQRFSAKDVLDHPWMRLPLFTPANNGNDSSSAASANGTNSYVGEDHSGYFNDV
jgi:serine/threonine protein kinase